MKSQFTLASLVLIFCACNNPRPEALPKPATPKALQDNSSADIVSKRYNGDIIQSLYSELVEKTPELKQLEESIGNIDESKADSLEPYVNFNNRNESYYLATNRYLLSIKDSILKNKVNQILESSLAKYHAFTAADSTFIKAIESKEIKLEDLHIALKLTLTLPLIEQYQKDNKPSIKSLEGFSKQFDKTIRTADSLLQK
jgi:hypothetical protein